MSSPERAAASLAAQHIADRMAAPSPPAEGEPWLGQSLAKGAAGTALLHIERAHTGHGTWSQAHAWVKAAAAGEISAADSTGLYLGAPALAFTLHAASARSADRYRSTLAVLDRHVADLAHRRADTATARIDRGVLPEFREFDLLFGLTGIGALLLHRDPGGSALERVLTYLVALTRPLTHEGRQLPGWWVGHDPHGPEHPMPGGHGNLGTAHGITGPLLLLSQAARRGITVRGQHESITTVLDWLDIWRQDSPAGPWWPEHLTRADLHTGRPTQRGPYRPSWCYGTPGIARAGQLAAIATADPARQGQFEDALSACLGDPEQLDRITDAGLCHGWAGLYQTTWRAASDATTPALHTALPHLAAELVRRSRPDAGPGFLEGDAGTALALTTAATGAPTSGWDACLLID